MPVFHRMLTLFLSKRVVIQNEKESMMSSEDPIVTARNDKLPAIAQERLDTLYAAASAVHGDGIDGVHRAARLVGQETAITLMFLHQLMRRSAWIWPAPGYVYPETQALLKHVGFSVPSPRR